MKCGDDSLAIAAVRLRQLSMKQLFEVLAEQVTSGRSFRDAVVALGHLTQEQCEQVLAAGGSATGQASLEANRRRDAGHGAGASVCLSARVRLVSAEPC